MECPKCQHIDILVKVEDDEKTYICSKCRSFWDEEMEVLGKISKRQLELFQYVIEWNEIINDIDFQETDASNVEKCIFCSKLAVKDDDCYKCHSCGGSWSVV